MALDQTTATTRRALLAGVLGAVAAVAAQALGRPIPGAAAGNLVLEQDNPTTASTSITTSSDAAFRGESTRSAGGVGVMGIAASGVGVSGFVNDPESTAVFGAAYAESGGETYGVAGEVRHPGGAALMGWNLAGGLAVAGRSGPSESAPPSTLRTAILGIAEQDHRGARGVVGRARRGQGVRGEATSSTGTGVGVYGKAASPTGYGVFSRGTLGTNRALELKVTSSPPKARPLVANVFARTTASGTQLCVRLPNGKVKVLASE